MTDKRIIDGVNVLNCGHYSRFDGKTKNACYIMQKTLIGKDETSKEYCSCEINPNCYFKQLKRKEQECEMLRKMFADIDSINVGLHKKLYQLKQTLADITTIIHSNKTNRLSGGACISIEQIIDIISEVENG